MSRRKIWGTAIGALLALIVVIAAQAGQAFYEQRQAVAQAEWFTGGDAGRAVGAMRDLGCGACHQIPGMRGATALVGPPLSHMASRGYIAGVMDNTPDNMILWIRWPQGVLPMSGMPNTGATERQARDIAAYLLSLR
jgi:cytochrome c1